MSPSSSRLRPASDFQPVGGTRFRLETQRLSADGLVAAQVTELDPPRRMVWSWSVEDGVPPATVAFERTPVALSERHDRAESGASGMKA